jgi:hypothetical protein
MKTYKIRNKADGGILEVTEDQLAEFGLQVPNQMAKGGMIKRADGSYSRRGLWDNIRANKGSGKKPTKAMLAQEKKIRAAEKAYGGYMDMGGYMNPYMGYGGMYDMGGMYPMDMMAQGGINNPGFRALPDYVQQNIIDNMAYGGCKECGGRMEAGGKMPQWLAEARFAAADKEDELGDYGYAADGKWIQKATASIKKRGTEGVCTGSKFGGPGCPPGSKRYNLAKTFRKMAKSKKEEGGYAQGGEYEMTDAEIAKLRSMGYKVKEV